MKSFFEKIMKAIETWGYKIAEFTYISVIRDAFVDLMPFIITGSFATLINNVICSTKNGIARYEHFAFLSQFSPIFSAINYATMNILALCLVYLVGAQVGQVRKISKQLSGLVALVSYVALIPQSAAATAEASKEVVNISNVLAVKYTNSQGMFLAIIVGILAVEIFSKLFTVEKLQIKMPETVPTGVANSFKTLLPAMITVLIIAISGFGFEKATSTNIPDFIYKVLQIPLEGIMQHPAGVIVLAIICQVFWMIGIHGSQLIGVVRNSIGFAAIAANLAAYEAGTPMPNIFTYTFWNTYVTIGGCGNTVALIAAIFIFSKREDYRAIAKLSVVPSIFGINEPMIFGIPIVLNPLLAIPFIIAPVVTATIGYVATAIGFAGPSMVTIPFTIPFLINAYVTTGGSYGAVITQIICIFVSFLIYIPFVKIANKHETA